MTQRSRGTVMLFVKRCLGWLRRDFCCAALLPALLAGSLAAYALTPEQALAETSVH